MLDRVGIRWLKARRRRIINLIILALLQFIHRFGSWSYELKNVFLKCSEAVRVSKAKIKFIPFRYSRWNERV